MAFAKKWGAIHPELIVEAIKEKANHPKTGDPQDYYQYLASPNIWHEYNEAYQNYFKNICMDDYEFLVEYAYDCAKTNNVKDFLTFLRASAAKDKILNHLYPYLVTTIYEYRASAVGWQHAGQLYLNSKEVWPDYREAMMQAFEQDPDNYSFMNEQALKSVGWGRFKLGRTIFNLIGDHWVSVAWTKEKFDQYKRVAFGKEKPTWHPCLSPEELRDEK
jgi:hypothetical protein